jgi:murein DD-endopeptidase MepM/ murein hydrolase activator NlpD
MARIKYYYDTKTCRYERLTTSAWDVILNTLGFLSVCLVFAVALVFLYTKYFQSPKEAVLERENAELALYFELMRKDLEEANDILASLQERDDKIYRVIFEAEPIPVSLRKGGQERSRRYKELLDKGIKSQEIILSTMARIDKLNKQLYIQTKSYDEIVKLAKNKSQMLASIPAIQPVSNKELSRFASGFGMRIHPIYKVKRMHTGCDFSAPRGTPIYATGNGKVKTVRTHPGGYGKEIEIDHGYGYVTKYAHLDNFNVKIGQKVKRGELIGWVGNTGASTAPHVHYEIIYNGRKVNPVHYFYQDLTPSDYERILEMASIENQSLS